MRVYPSKRDVSSDSLFSPAGVLKMRSIIAFVSSSFRLCSDNELPFPTVPADEQVKDTGGPGKAKKLPGASQKEMGTMKGGKTHEGNDKGTKRTGDDGGYRRQDQQ